jgi:hypothetical protein
VLNAQGIERATLLGWGMNVVAAVPLPLLEGGGVGFIITNFKVSVTHTHEILNPEFKSQTESQSLAKLEGLLLLGLP